ncbi:MAG: MBL fold metallo-hydrolase [Candidatus Promineifilaceae bacterium]
MGLYQTNCYLLVSEQERVVAVVDPAWDGSIIASHVSKAGWRVSHILLTHPHLDHVGGLAELKELSGAPVYLHPEGAEMLARAAVSARLQGLELRQPAPADHALSDGQRLQVGQVSLETIYAPGHAPGHVCFYAAEHQLLFAGDVLFQDSIGRTDLPGGDYKRLMASIRGRLLTLPDETAVLSGHGPATTIGRERRSNPFLVD